MYKVMGYKYGYSDERRYYYDEFPIMFGDHWQIVSGKVTRRTDKESTFALQVDALHQYASWLTPHDTYVVVSFDDTMLFRGRVIKRSEAASGIITLTCEGFMSYLHDVTIYAGSYSGTLQGFLEQIVGAYNAQQSTYYRAKNIQAEVYGIGTNVSYIWNDSTAWNILQDALVKGNGIKSVPPTYDPVVSEWTINEDKPLHIVEEEGKLFVTTADGVGRQTISQGVNLIDFTIEENGVNDYTHLRARHKIASTESYLTEDLINDAFPEYHGTHIDRVIDFPLGSNPALLRKYGEQYIRYTNTNRYTYKVRGFDQGLLGEVPFFSLKTAVAFRYKKDGQWLAKLLPITSIEYNLTNPAADRCTLGTVQKKLTEFM